MRLDEVLRYFFIELVFLGYAFAAIVRLFAMDEVVMEMEGIVGLDCLLIRQVHRSVLKYMGRVMVDDHYRASRWRNRSEGVRKLRLLEELSQMRNLFHIEIVRAAA